MEVSDEVRTGVTNHPSIGIKGSNVFGETLCEGRAISFYARRDMRCNQCWNWFILIVRVMIFKVIWSRMDDFSS